MPNNIEYSRDVLNELARAEEIYPPFNSAHEGYAILLEELDELWDEVKRKPADLDLNLMYLEATQVAAMAIRFMKLIDRQRTLGY